MCIFLSPFSFTPVLNLLILQKLVFLDSAEKVATTLRPYWSEATGDHASVVQAVPDMLEIVPHGTSKGNGVKLLLDHLGATSDEVCHYLLYNLHKTILRKFLGTALFV